MMSDKDDLLPPMPPEKRPYAIAFVQAFTELQELKQEERRIAIRKAQLHETLKALGPLVSSTTVDISTMSLADAIRLVVRSAGRPVNAIEIRSRLKDLGYNLDRFENPLASIHTALNRMQEAEELKEAEWDGSEKKTKKFEPGPELKTDILPSPDELESIAKKMRVTTSGKSSPGAAEDFAPSYGYPDPLNKRGK
jgi:hypothetical protein